MRTLMLEIKDEILRKAAQAIFQPPFRDGIILQHDYDGGDPVRDAMRILKQWYADAAIGAVKLILIELARALHGGEAVVKVVEREY